MSSFDWYFYQKICNNYDFFIFKSVASKYGGVEIEEVAKKHPESMIVHPIDIKKGLEDKDAIEIAKKLELGDVAE